MPVRWQATTARSIIVATATLSNFAGSLSLFVDAIRRLSLRRNFEDRETEEEFELNDSSSYGLSVNFPSRGNTEWEIYYSFQDTEVDAAGFVPSENAIGIEVEYLQIGGTYLFETRKNATPYFVCNNRGNQNGSAG